MKEKKQEHQIQLLEDLEEQEKDKLNILYFL
jgi:hypothetical protein